MSFRLSGSDLVVSFAAIASSCESSLGSSGSSGNGRSESEGETKLVMMFWWLCCWCAVGIAAVVNTVRRGGAALVCVVMEMMYWFDAAVEYAVQCVWAGCDVASRKWCGVNSCVTSGLCGFAVAIVSTCTAFSRMVMATVCGAVGAVQGSGMSAKLGASGGDSVCCTSEPSDVVLVGGDIQQEANLLRLARMTFQHAVDSCDCGVMAAAGRAECALTLAVESGVCGSALCGLLEARRHMSIFSGMCSCEESVNALRVALDLTCEAVVVEAAADELRQQSMVTAAAAGAVRQQPMVTAAAENEVVQQPVVVAASENEVRQQPHYNSTQVKTG